MTNNNQDFIQRTESFLFGEARLMDDNDYQGWLDLWDQECSYWIPSNQEDYDPKLHISILYCDRPMLEQHIARLLEGKAFAQSPKSRLMRSVTNVMASQKGTTIDVTANFLVTGIRSHQQHSHAGRSEYQLRECDSGFLIQKKKVILLALDEPQDNVTFLL